MVESDLVGIQQIVQAGQRGLENQAGSVNVKTDKQAFTSGKVINCGGLYSDKLAKLTLDELEYKIIPFRGEYYDLKPSAFHLVKGLIYPVPDPNFPFLGVHFNQFWRKRDDFQNNKPSNELAEPGT